MNEVNVDYSHFAVLRPGDANVIYGDFPPFRRRGFVSNA
jgi:hypothetical protein